MRLETKIAILLMLAALAMSSCTKKTITPAEDPQPAEVGFTAASQAVWVKGGDETPQTPQFSDLYDVNGNQKCSDFGNSECSIFGIKTTVLLASAVQ